MRTRAPVSYNDKNQTGMVPAWLKTIQPNVNDPPSEPKRKKKTARQRKNVGTSPEKENASDIPASDNSPTVKSKGPPGKSNSKAGAKESQQKNNVNDKVTKKRVAARGRNAGLKIVPIGMCTLLTFLISRHDE